MELVRFDSCYEVHVALSDRDCRLIADALEMHAEAVSGPETLGTPDQYRFDYCLALAGAFDALVDAAEHRERLMLLAQEHPPELPGCLPTGERLRRAVRALREAVESGRWGHFPGAM